MTFYRTGQIVMAAALLVFSGCAKEKGVAGGTASAAAANPAAELKTAADFFPMTIGGKAVRVQVAATEAEKARGLMGRTNLGENDAMLFLFEQPQRMSFWMRNTPSPLDIGYLRADGTLGEVYPMYPYDETPVRSVAEDYSLAIEFAQGWFAKNGVAPGAKLDLKQLAAAMEARGLRPARYGIWP